MRALPNTRMVWQANSVQPEKRQGWGFGIALIALALVIAVAMAFDIHLGHERQAAKYADLEAEHQATAAALKTLGEQAEKNTNRAWGADNSRPLTAAEQAEREWAAAEAKWMDTDGNPATEPKRPTLASNQTHESTATTAQLTATPATACVNYIQTQTGERHCLVTPLPSSR